MRDEYLKTRFPGLQDGTFQTTSPATGAYNCIAWAGGDDSRVWIPDPWGVYHWPIEAGDDSLDGWIQAFGQLGYISCDNGEMEPGYEKIVIYGTEGGPQHVARQLPSGLWTSKLGKSEDIEHEIAGVSGASYGDVLIYLRRQQNS
jgi:hypothetical protein